MMQLPNLIETSWTHTGVPECLWLAAIAIETKERAAAHVPLDLLSEFVPEGREVLDGRITTLSLVPEKSRSDARDVLREHASFALPKLFLRAFSRFPESPAAWLFEMPQVNDEEPDEDVAGEYLKDLVRRTSPPRDAFSAELRLMVLARYAKAGKLHLAQGIGTAELLDKYPTLLDASERARVESFVRASWNGLVGIREEERLATARWSEYFWSRCYATTECDLTSARPEEGFQDDEDLPEEREHGSDPDQTSVGDLRALLVLAAGRLGTQLSELQFQAELNTFDPEEPEVKLGLASRAFRLLKRFVANPALWSNDMAPHLIRSLVDLRIVVAWLGKQNDPELYKKFKDYGRGKRKLFKLKLEELMDENVDLEGDTESLHARLEAELNVDSMEEFVEIDLGGNFAGKSIREMAIETDLADLYSLTYQPLSTEAHGEWGSLVAFDLDHCLNPLHLYHRVGRFETGEEVIVQSGWVKLAIDLAQGSIEELFEGLGLDATGAFEDFDRSIAKQEADPSFETDEQP